MTLFILRGLIVAGFAAVSALIKRTGDQIMAKLDEIKAQIAQANTATNDIANDIQQLKAQLDSAISNIQSQIDEAAQGQLQEVSDALQPLVTRLESVASGDTGTETP